jgi:hypothetical protein
LKSKIFNLLLILTSFIGYLEWGGGSSTLLIQAEVEIISKLFTDPISAIHPFTILPLVGQLLLLYTLFQKKPGTYLTYFGIGGIGILLALMFIIGLMSFNYKIILSTLPFLVTALLAIRHYRKR